MKDSYWFKHDSNSGRDIKLRKIQHIYGHEGKGLFWDVVELLREEENYKLPTDESSMQMLCDLIGYKDIVRFLNWFNDCVKVGLFIIDGNVFYSQSLLNRMKVWETKKDNGLQPKLKAKKKRNGSEIEADGKAKRKHKIREDNIIEENINNSFSFYKEQVELAKQFNDDSSKGYIDYCNHVCLKNIDKTWRLPWVLTIKNQLSLGDFIKLYKKANSNTNLILDKVDSLQTNIDYHGKYEDIYLTINKWLTK